MEIHIPARYEIKKIPPGAKPDDMLLAGNLDAIITPQKFPSLLANVSHVKRLFENYEEVEKAFYRKTGIFPIMHTVAIRENLVSENPWIAGSLYEAFKKAKQMAYDSLDDWDPYKLSMVWSRETVREQREMFGSDPWPYGVKDNLGTLQTLAGYLFEQGLINSQIDVRELFTPNTRET
jgi:4,5-dihydroxyphthalate decarboxylase